MRKLFIAALVAASCTFASCASGPHQLSRSVDDWDQEVYVERPWLNGLLHFVPVFPIIKFGAAVGDFFVTDAYTFWFQDLWDGKGTGFKHYEVKPTDGHMSSLLIEGSGFMKVTR